MTSYEIASIPYVREILHPGSDREGRSLDELERAILESWDIRDAVSKKVWKSRSREITALFPYEENHLPENLRRGLVRKTNGAFRETVGDHPKCTT